MVHSDDFCPTARSPTSWRPGYLTFPTPHSRQVSTYILRRCHFSWSWVNDVLHRHKTHTYVIAYVKHLTYSEGPKVRFSAGSTW